MRVDNTSVDTVAAQTSAAATQRVWQQNAPLSTNKGAAATSDQATLSSATNLVAIAKGLTSASRQAKLTALGAQVRSGAYQGSTSRSTSRASQAMVQELLQRVTSPG